MSAFIVQDGVINRIVDYLSYDWFNPLHVVSHPIKHLGYDLANKPERLARHMHNLNRFAIWERYNNIPARTYKYRDLQGQSNRHQVLKDLRCFLYQCGEGRAQCRPLFKALEDVKDTLMCEIIGDIPEYKSTVYDKT